MGGGGGGRGGGGGGGGAKEEEERRRLLAPPLFTSTRLRATIDAIDAAPVVMSELGELKWKEDDPMMYVFNWASLSAHPWKVYAMRTMLVCEPRCLSSLSSRSKRLASSVWWNTPRRPCA